MMGGHHAACGAAAWVAVATQLEIPLNAVKDLVAEVPVLPAIIPETLHIGAGLMDVSPMGVVTGALVCAGAALVPDADHHNATIAHSLPPLSNAMCAGVGAAAGGHRHGTHSVIGIAAFTLIAWLAGLWTIETDVFGTVFPGAGILAVLLVAFAAKALKIIPDAMRKSPWIVGITFGLLVALFAPQEQHWFVVAMGLGVIVHIIGDMLTVGGCNLVWPLTVKPPKALQVIPVLTDCWKPNGYLAFPILGKAGSGAEWLLCIPVAAYALIGVGATLAGMGQTAVAETLALLGVTL